MLNVAPVVLVQIRIVTVPAEEVKLRQNDVVLLGIVTVYVPAVVKKTSSVDVGKDAPVGVRVGLSDHLAVSFQVPVPPTQYLSAMTYSCGTSAGTSSGGGGAVTIAIQLS